MEMTNQVYFSFSLAMKGCGRFVLFSLMGNWQFLIDSATSYPDLVQETVSGAEIKESGFISAMD